MRSKVASGVNATHPVDVVTIIFDDELPLLSIQARSLSRFMEPDLIGSIIVFINERMPETCRKYINNIVLPLYGPHRFKVSIHEAASIGPVPELGWLGQQACKLIASRYAASPYFLTLDAKHHLTRHVCFNDLVSDGRARKSLHPARTDRRVWLNQRAWLADSLVYFGSDPALADAPSPASCPPFLLHAATAREMVQAIECREAMNMLTFFATKQDLTTEYTLYFAWLVSQGTNDSYLADSPDACCSLRPSTPTERLASVDQNLRSGQAWLLAVSRGHLAHLPNADRSVILNAWTRYGLFDSHKAANAELGTLEAHFAARIEREHERRTAMLRHRRKLRPMITVQAWSDGKTDLRSSRERTDD